MRKRLGLILKKIDLFLFAQAKKIEASAFAKKLRDSTSSLSEQNINLLSKFVNLTIILLPLFIVMYFAHSNISIKNELEIKEKVIGQIQYFNTNQNKILNMATKVTSSKSINSEDDLRLIISRIAKNKNIDRTKFSMSFFDRTQLSNAFFKTESTINFSNMSMYDFTTLLEELLDKEEMRITKINISRNNKTDSLDGNLRLAHYGK